MTETTATGGEYPDAVRTGDSEPAPDQTDEQRELTDFLGAVQTTAEDKGWEFEVLSHGDPTILGMRSPGGTPFSLQMNRTP